MPVPGPEGRAMGRGPHLHAGLTTSQEDSGNRLHVSHGHTAGEDVSLKNQLCRGMIYMQ